MFPVVLNFYVLISFTNDASVPFRDWDSILVLGSHRHPLLTRSGDLAATKSLPGTLISTQIFLNGKYLPLKPCYLRFLLLFNINININITDYLGITIMGELFHK